LTLAGPAVWRECIRWSLFLGNHVHANIIGEAQRIAPRLLQEKTRPILRASRLELIQSLRISECYGRRSWDEATGNQALAIVQVAVVAAWARRHKPFVASTTALILAVLFLGGAWAWWYQREQNDAGLIVLGNAPVDELHA
jgi:hypothetical protein